VQAHPDWTIAQIRQNLFETASDYVVNGFPDPEFARGYGIVDAFSAAQDCNGNDVADLIDIAAGAPDDDGTVNVEDFLALLGAWGSSDPTYDIAPDGGDGIVDIQDFLALLAAWGPCP
jgi:hypothetical protein